MGFSEAFGVAVVDVVDGVNSWKIGVEGGTVFGGRSRGGGLPCRLRGGGDRGQGCLGALTGLCLSDVTSHEPTR